jgi:hypothetical protein
MNSPLFFCSFCEALWDISIILSLEGISLYLSENLLLSREEVNEGLFDLADRILSHQSAQVHTHLQLSFITFFDMTITLILHNS